MVIRRTPELNYQDKPITIKVQCHSNKLFVNIRKDIHDNGVPLYIYIVQRESNKKSLETKTFETITYI